MADSVRRLARIANTGITLVEMHTLRQHMFHARNEDTMVAGIFPLLAGWGPVLAAAGQFGVMK